MAKHPTTGSSGHNPLGPKVSGIPDATEPNARAREVEQALRFARRPDVIEVYLGDAAKKKFGSPIGEKFPDVVAVMKNSLFGLGEGKGTDMAKVVEQFDSAGRRLQSLGRVELQEVIVPRLIDSEFKDAAGRAIQLAGPGYGVDAQGHLLNMTGPGPLWLPQIVNGKPIMVIPVK